MNETHTGDQRASAMPVATPPGLTASLLAGVIIILASVCTQALGYITALPVPDFITAIPTAIALLLALPTLLKQHPLKGWPGFTGSACLLLCVYVLSAVLRGPTMESARTIVQIALSLSCTAVGFSLGMSTRRSTDRTLIYGCFTCILALIALMLFLPPKDGMPKNLIGSEIMYLSVIAVTARMRLTGKRGSMRLLGPLLIVGGAVASHRAVLGLGVATFVLERLLAWQKSRFAHRVVIVGAALVSVAIVFMYLNTDLLPGFDQWNLFVQEHTGRQITSGRQLIWPTVFREVIRDPLFGQGFSVSAAQLTGLNFSTHNAFLMVLLQVGCVGMIPLLMTLGALAWKATSGYYTPWRTMVTITVVIVIVNNTFETELIQNNFRIQSLLWLSLGLACARIPIRKHSSSLVNESPASLVALGNTPTAC